MIPFNKPIFLPDMEIKIKKSLQSGNIGGNGPFSQKIQSLLIKKIKVKGEIFLTTSCTHALEASAIALNLKKNDEVIVPAYTFVTSASAFYLNGAKIRFCDIRNDTLNIDENKIEKLINKKTKAIVPVHYAGVSCEMDKVLELSSYYNLVTIEDNAHGLFSKYKGKYLGTMGDFATQSFHETKNFSCGEGGAIIVNNKKYIDKIEKIVEKGTNRKIFLNGLVNKYSWVDSGSSYLISDILASILYSQLQNAKKIQEKRKLIWIKYNTTLFEWALQRDIKLPFVPNYCEQSYHIFYLIFPKQKHQKQFINYLSEKGIKAAFHYLPLNSSKMGKKISPEDVNKCNNANDLSKKIVRLPIFYDLSNQNQNYIIETIKKFKLQ